MTIKMTESRLRGIIREVAEAELAAVAGEEPWTKVAAADLAEQYEAIGGLTQIAGAARGAPPSFRVKFGSEAEALGFMAALPRARGGRRRAASLDARVDPQTNMMTYIVRFETDREPAGRGGPPDPVPAHLRVNSWLLLDPVVNEALKDGLKKLDEKGLEFVMDRISKLGMDDPGKRMTVLDPLQSKATPEALKYALAGLGALPGLDREAIKVELKTNLPSMLNHLLAARGGFPETSVKVAAVMAKALEEIKREAQAIEL